MKDAVGVSVEGHVLIKAYDNMDEEGEILLDQHNAIHREHMSIIIARGVADKENGTVYAMYFGSGGATVDALGNITYSETNTTGSADLNSSSYYEIVDSEVGAPTGNQMTVRHTNGTLYTDVVVRCVIGKNEPYGQSTTDSSSDTEGEFTFDEIGLKSTDGLLLTHIVFSPIEKSSNRIIEVVYTLRFTVSA